MRLLRGSVLAGGLLLLTAAAPNSPVVVQPGLALTLIGTLTAGPPAQMVFGPDGRLYISLANANDRTAASVVSYVYDPAGVLSAPVVVASTGGAIGVAFGAVTLGPPDSPTSVRTTGMYLTDMTRDGVSNVRVLTRGPNGHYGLPGGTNTVIVRNIPGGYHQADQIVIKGGITLYVGIGVRTPDGVTGFPKPENAGENAYGGTISQILDLRLVNGVAADSAGFGLTGDTTDNSRPDYRNAGPFTSTSPAKLIVHSAGARNPFGLALDERGDLWFTNNFATVEAQGTFDGSLDPATHVVKGFDLGDLSLPDRSDPDLKTNVYDQLFKAVPLGDYGYNNANWRNDGKGSNPQVTSDEAARAGFFDFTRHGVRSVTYDNLVPHRGGFAEYDQSDINHIVGLGPGASADGFAFYTGNTFPAVYRGKAFITRWTKPTADSTGHKVTYQDVIAVDVTTGIGRQVAKGFTNPLAALEDGHGNVLIADYGARAIYRISPAAAGTAGK